MASGKSRSTTSRRNIWAALVMEDDAIAARLQAEIKYFGEFRYNPLNLCPGLVISPPRLLRAVRRSCSANCAH